MYRYTILGNSVKNSGLLTFTSNFSVVTLVTCQSRIVPALVSCKPHFYVLLLILIRYHTSVCFTNKFDWLIEITVSKTHFPNCAA